MKLAGCPALPGTRADGRKNCPVIKGVETCLPDGLLDRHQARRKNCPVIKGVETESLRQVRGEPIEAGRIAPS